jgi:hypothetical protein
MIKKYQNMMPQFDTSVIDSIDSVYKLISLIIITGTYIFTMIYNRKNNKKQIKELTDEFDEQNKRIIDKIEQLRSHNNILDEQSSINIITLTLNMSMINVSEYISDIIDNVLFNTEKVLFMPKKSLIYEKVKDVVNSNFSNDIIILNKIYHNNIKLSHFISEYNKEELIEEIVNKLLSTTSADKKEDILVFIRNKYSQIIQSIQLKLTK